jgi:hypothetical protein
MKVVALVLASVAATALIGCGSVSDTPSDCTAPCAGDPVDDFTSTQGGSNGRWLYLADTRAINGADYVEMTYGDIGGTPAWVGPTGSSPAGIMSCKDNEGTPDCDGVASSLLLFPGSDQDPALAFVAQAEGTYTVTGKVRPAIGTPEGLPQRFLLSRNTRHDLLDTKVHVTSPVPDDFTAEVELLTGDRLILTFVGGASSVPIAFDFHLTLIADGPSAFPGKCQFAATFDGTGADALRERCRGGSIQNLNDGIGPPGMSQPAASVNDEHGDARDISEGQYLSGSGGPLDKTGDFTIQWWSKLDEPQPSFSSTPYSDRHDPKNGMLGGVAVFLDDDTSLLTFCSMWRGGLGNCLDGVRPTDSQWHFYRITRSMTEAQLELCIDGVATLTDPNPGTADMTSDVSPTMGRNVDFNPAYFGGLIDDVRGFNRALPCPTPP